MSVIVAKKVKGGFILAGDSMVTSGQRRGATTKIFKASKEDDVYIGIVGYLRDANLLMTMDSLLDVNAIRRESLDLQSVITYTVPALQKQLKEQGRLSVEDGMISWESEIIIAYKDKAFEISEDFTVQEIDEFDAIGSPRDFVIGAYEVLTKFSKLSNFDIVKEVVKMAIEKTIYVFYPINIIDTSKDKDFTVIEGEIICKDKKKGGKENE